MADDIVLMTDLPEGKLAQFVDGLGEFPDEARLPEAEEHREGGIYLLQDPETTPGGEEAPAGTFRVAGLVTGAHRLPLVFLMVQPYRLLREAGNGPWICWSRNMREAAPDVPDTSVPPLAAPQEKRTPSRRCEDCEFSSYTEDGEYCRQRARYLVYSPTRNRCFVLDGSPTNRHLLESINAQLDELTAQINTARAERARAAGLTPGTKKYERTGSPVRAIPNTAAVIVLYSVREEKDNKKWYAMRVSLAPRDPGLIELSRHWPPSQADITAAGSKADDLYPWILTPEDAQKLALIARINSGYARGTLSLCNLTWSVDDLKAELAASVGTKAKPAVEKSTVEKPSAITKPAITKPAKKKPAITKPAKKKPAITKPAKKKPAKKKPAKKKPAKKSD